jgi:Domain of unknown function (DUF3943)
LRQACGQQPWRLGLLALLCAAPALAEEPTKTEQKVSPTAFNRDELQPLPGWGVGKGRSWWVPVADIIGFDFLLNQFDRNFVEPKEDFRSDWDSIEQNATGSWVYDHDTFDINQFGHPYQGSMYHTFARSAGLGYWPSLGYTFAGSAFWEVAGETTPPSINDQLTTGIGGTFLGEPLFRMASLLLESTPGQSKAGRTFAASLVSPATGFNRMAYGRRFDGVFRSHDPAVHTKANFGANTWAEIRSDAGAFDTTVPPSYEQGQPVIDFTMVYGLPGKPDYAYERPFDYFNFQLTAATGNVLENLITRGLLVGAKVGDDGEHYRGIWGLYGSYDYIAPQIFRVSNTALNVGTTGQWWISKNVALQNEFMAGLGYGSGGTSNRSPDYHYGMTPQGLVGLRLIMADVAALEVTARDYYITDRGSDTVAGSENLARADVSLTVRVKDLHGITVRYVMSDRNAQYDDLADIHQRVAAINIGYTYLGHKWFGAVDWRPRPEQRTEEHAPLEEVDQ